jgi:hypothetical protein
MRWLLVLATLLGGCMSHSQIGPYVKSVSRNGNWLVVVKCVIELHGEDLAEGACTQENLPLVGVPVQPPPMQPPPMQQPPPAQVK